MISIETQTTSEGKYSATFLPENFYNDNSPIRSFGDNGYLISSDDREEVEEKAREWMEENPKN